MKTKNKVPADFPVKPLRRGENPPGKTTCGTCGRSWDDDIPTQWTPVPAGRCPFEYFHDDEPEPPRPAMNNETNRATWRVSSTRTREHWLDIRDNTGTICQVMDIYGMATMRDRANLIAAAPDLLEALKEARAVLQAAKRYFPKSIRNRDEFSRLNVLANAIEPAIAKCLPRG